MSKARFNQQLVARNDNTTDESHATKRERLIDDLAFLIVRQHQIQQRLSADKALQNSTDAPSHQLAKRINPNRQQSS